MVTIRTATADDADGIARVHVESWHDSYPGIVPDDVLQRMSPRRYALTCRHMLAAQGRRATTVVAHDPVRGVVGYAGCGPSRLPNLGFDGEVYTLYLDPELQDRGVGRQLLARCFRELAQRRYGGCIIWVLADNPSRFFYHAMGGKVVARRDEPMWGTILAQYGYGWVDVAAAVGALDRSS